MPKWLKTTLKIIAALIGLIIILFVSITLYVVTHKKKVLTMVTTTLNRNINGTLTIGDMNPTFFKGFPDVSLTLKDVTLKDKKWNEHRHTLLTAKALAVSVNTAALLKGVIQVNSMSIADAAIDLYTDTTGYSNTAIFGKKPKAKNEKTGSESATEIKRFSLNNVTFTLDNQQAKKLFNFAVDQLDGHIDYPGSGWHAGLELKTLAKSMSFNTRQGSFIKNRELEGGFDISYDRHSKFITAAPETLNIGGIPFIIGAKFSTGQKANTFAFDISAPSVLWQRAASLLAPNITRKLNMFGLKNPLEIHCLLNGSFSGGNDPDILVTCKVRDNVLSAIGGTFDHCSFDGLFTNNYIKGMGLTDANSAIKIYHLTANYKELPILIDTAIINNLDHPVGMGTVRSKFDVAKVNNLLGNQTLSFTRGAASLRLAVKANFEDFRLHKPEVHGIINVANADVSYVPRNLNFKNTSISLNFTGNDLLLNNIRLQTGRSIVLMQGRVNNFLNLYYDAPENILLTWQMHSPQLYLAEFLGFLSSRRNAAPARRTAARTPAKSSASFIDQFNSVFEKARAEMHLTVDNLHYKKFLATSVNANLFVSADGIALKNVSLKQAGGSLKLNGSVVQTSSTNRFTLNTAVDNANIRNFFYSFDNFGLKDLTYQNLTGFLSAQTNITGNVTDAGSLVPNSVNGTVAIDLKKGALINFAPIKSVGKYAFPFRNLNNITFDDLTGKFDLHGEKITIEPMMINSSVLNLDVAGIYSLGKGTNIALDVPLRDPGKDKDKSKEEKTNRRMNGIVLHLLATDEGTGKMKIKLNHNHK